MRAKCVVGGNLRARRVLLQDHKAEMANDQQTWSRKQMTTSRRSVSHRTSSVLHKFYTFTLGLYRIHISKSGQSRVYFVNKKQMKKVNNTSHTVLSPTVLFINTTGLMNCKLFVLDTIKYVTYLEISMVKISSMIKHEVCSKQNNIMQTLNEMFWKWLKAVKTDSANPAKIRNSARILAGVRFWQD